MQNVQQLVRNVQDAAHLVKSGYDELVAAIIRPPRAEYNMDDLGPQRFIFAGRIYHRVDFEVPSARAEPLLLRCSRWSLEPRETQTPSSGSGRTIEPRPCVIFLHGNASCRVQGAGLLKTVLSASCDLVAFDFGGSGQSDGEFVTLGHFEKEDLRAVIGHLRLEGSVASIGLWGRSMGAVTALLHSHRDPSISALVLDSPFHEFRSLAAELCEKETYGAVPPWLAEGALAVVRVSIQKRAGFDVDELVPSTYAASTHIPAIFAAAHDDDFILPYHSRVLQKTYAGQSTLLMMEGDHNSYRPQWFLDEAKHFFARALRGRSFQKQDSEAAAFMQNVMAASPAPITMPRPSEPAEDSPRSLVGDQASSAAGAAPMSHREDERAAYEAPKDKMSIEQQLLALGFPKESVEAAMKRNSTLESCVEWVLTNG